MYTPHPFREPEVGRSASISTLSNKQGFGVLISNGATGPVISHLPVLVDRGQGKLCLLRAHVAKANDHWHFLDDQPVTMVFNGPHCYVSAGWYRERRVVPTWNYVTVLHGMARMEREIGAKRRMVADFVAHFEAGSPEPWSIPADATGYLDGLLDGIVAFTIDVQRIEATRKLNQNHSAERRRRVIAALRESGKPNEIEIAGLMGRQL